MKRSLDLLLSLLLLFLAVPLLLVAAVGIKLRSPGPILYNSLRTGKNGREFSIHKFRTMHVNSRAAAAITRPDDDRIFPFGRFLRATKIDELPQLMNILKGDMSFVGPRPEDPDIVRDFYADWMMETLDVRPGLTSPGTLSYMREFRKHENVEDFQKLYAETMLPNKIRHDLTYMRSRTMLVDLGLIWETGTIVLKKLFSFSFKE